MSFALALVVAAASGFIALSYEILWYRVIAFASWGLPGAFGLLLSAYLFGLAFGSRVAGSFCKDDAKQGDPRQLRIVAGFVLVANLVAWLVVPAFGWSAKRWDWPPALLMVLLAAGLLGAILPLVSHFGIKADDRAGQRLSYVYLANIVGSAAGSLLTGFVFLDAFPLATASAIVGVLGMLLFAALLFVAEMHRFLPIAGIAAVGIWLATPAAYDRIWERLMYKGAFTQDTKFADVIETKSGVITVTQNDVVYGGGAYDGKFNTSLRWDKNGIMRAYGVGAMHPAPKRMLMVGLASGSWAKVLSNLPGLEKLTIVEINPGYTQLIAKHEEVAGILEDPKVEIVIDDGRRWLNRHDEKFDVIVQNTTWHWRAHITSLLSEEYFELVRAHLAKGGFFYFNTTSSADVQKTAASHFPHALRVYNFMAVSDSPLSFDKTRWQRTLEDYRIDGEPAVDRSDADGQKLLAELLEWPDTVNAPPRDDGIESRESVLARTQAALLVTDDNMVPEWQKVLRFQDPPVTFFVPDGDRFRATENTRGPWSPDHMHGGPPSALLARAVERHVGGEELRVARASVVFHRPLPIDSYRVLAETTREGKKVRIVRAQLVDTKDRVSATADMILIRCAAIDVETTPATNDRLPEACPPYTFTFFADVRGYHTAMECRHLHGTFGEGRMGLWMRMRVPLLPGETPSPLVRTMIAADSGNGVSVALDLSKFTFVNPDLTVALAREPDGEWIGLDARTSFGPDGVGLADTRLLDEAGTIGRGIQTLIVESRSTSN